MIKLLDSFSLWQRICLVLLFISGTFIQGLTMVRNGLSYPFGLGFWGPNGHDGVWHLALVNQVLKGFPPPHPTFSGEVLTNYHYFYDLLIALINLITRIPSINLYFQIFPVLLAFLLGILTFFIGYKLTKDFWVGFWFAFLNYFAGSFGYLVTIWQGHGIGGESLFWSMQSISTQMNPPYSLSLIMILFGLSFLLKADTFKKWQIIFWSIFFGLIVNVKIYAGIIFIPGLLLFGFSKYRDGQKKPLMVAILSTLIAVMTFILVNRKSGSLLVFQPFWFISSLIESQDRLYLPRLASARYNFAASGDYLKLSVVESIGFVIFLIGNLGTRLIGLPTLIKSLKFPKQRIEIIFLTSGLISLIIPLVFVQKGTSWNTIQFFYYFLFFLNFYTAIALVKFISSIRSYLKLIFISLFILLTIPTTYSTFKNYLGYPPPVALLKNEQEALKFLKEQPKKNVLTYPFDRYANERLKLKEPLPFYVYETTSYVSAFSGKNTFLEDEMNLNISGYDWGKRRESLEHFLSSDNKFQARGLLTNNQIDYIYLLSDQSLPYSDLDLGIKKIYERDQVRIYEVLR